MSSSSSSEAEDSEYLAKIQDSVINIADFAKDKTIINQRDLKDNWNPLSKDMKKYISRKLFEFLEKNIEYCDTNQNKQKANNMRDDCQVKLFYEETLFKSNKKNKIKKRKKEIENSSGSEIDEKYKSVAVSGELILSNSKLIDSNEIQKCQIITLNYNNDNLNDMNNDMKSGQHAIKCNLLKQNRDLTDVKRKKL